MDPKTFNDIVVDKCFDNDQCDEIIKIGGDWIEGTVQAFNSQITMRDKRSVLISKNNLPEELIENIFFKIFQINKKTFRYHIEGFEIHDLPRIFRYESDRKDHYVWHRDSLSIPGKSVRKLSFSIQLSDPADYQGGDLEFMPENTNALMKQKGNIIVFPSYITHRVSPMLYGARYAIVGFIHGPEWK